MTRTLIPVIVLVLAALVGFASFRRNSDRVRLAFDCACFAGISCYFIWQRIVPIFPPLSDESDTWALSLRVLGGARAASDIGAPGQLLARIRSFFGIGPQSSAA